MDFILVAFLLSAFLICMGLIIFSLRQRLADGPWYSPKNILGYVAVMYLAIAHIGILTASGEALFLVNQAPCENMINSTLANGNLTSYTYVDSCVNRELPSSAERLHVIYSYLFYLEIILVLFSLIYGLGWVINLW